jgi:signal transduction histidine kinase
LQSATSFELLLMIGLGIGYITIGIYGYAFAARSGKLGFHLTYFTVQLFLGGMIVFLGKGVGFNAMVLLPLAGHSVMLVPNRWRLVINTVIVVVYAMALNPLAMNNWGLVWAGLPMFLAGQIFIVAFTQMAVSEEKARAEVEELVRELEEANQSLRAFTLQVEELAIAKERNRMAREIHDGLGHYLTTIHMQIQAARAVMKKDPTKSQEALETAQNLTQEALVDVRRSVAALRDVPGDSISLQEEIVKMLKGTENTGITTDVKVVGTPRALAPQTVLTLYRAVQEGINNTCKHAQASRLWVSLDYTNDSRVKLILQDDGIGAEGLDGGGFGLLGMRERVTLLKGDLSIMTEPQNGFRLEVSLPG